MKIFKTNSQFLFAKGPSLFLLIILFMSSSVYCQITNNRQKIAKMNFDYGENVKLNINEEIQFDDSLSILLTSFSHKHPYSGGPTKATAYITLSKNKISEEETLSIHGVSGKSEKEYDTIHWNKYKIQLKAFNYDESIEVVVTKMK